MLPEVEQYFDTIDGVEALLAKADTTVKVAAAKAFADTTREAAWTWLGASTDSKLVAWIVAKFVDEDDEETLEAVTAILKRLPASQAELEEFAETQNWCDSFEGYLQQAIEAGAFEAEPDAWKRAPEVTAAMGEVDGFARRYGAGSSQLEEVHKLVLAVAAAALVADDRLTERRAREWGSPEAEPTEAPVAVPGSDSMVLDISEWPEWTALYASANRVMSPAYIETLKGHVTAVAVFAAENPTRTHLVEDSDAASALRSWVTSIGGESRLGELRTLVTPIVVRAARRS